MKKVGMPNLLLDADVQWGAPVGIVPRLNATPRGYQSFQFGDLETIRALNLPEVALNDRRHLLQLSTGPYILHRQVRRPVYDVVWFLGLKSWTLCLPNEKCYDNLTSYSAFKV